MKVVKHSADCRIHSKHAARRFRLAANHEEDDSMSRRICYLFAWGVLGMVVPVSASAQCPQDLTCTGSVGGLGIGTADPAAALHAVAAIPSTGTGVISTGTGSQIIGSGTR